MKEVTWHMVDKIIWHYCELEMPTESGRYLVSRSFQDGKCGYVDIALYMIDMNKFDRNVDNSIYAWAELPGLVQINREAK